MPQHRVAVAIFFVVFCGAILVGGGVPHPWLFVGAAAIVMIGVVAVIERSAKGRR